MYNENQAVTYLQEGTRRSYVATMQVCLLIKCSYYTGIKGRKWGSLNKKSSKRETQNLSTDTDRSTATKKNKKNTVHEKKGGGEGFSNERPGSDHLIWGPMRGLKKIARGGDRQTDRQTDGRTSRLLFCSGDSVKNRFNFGLGFVCRLTIIITPFYNF